MVIPMPTLSKTCRLLVTLSMLTLSSAWTTGAFAAVPWHPDLPAARRAAEISHRPVLAIFTASWSTASTTLDRTTLASDEAVALITACFEPVCVDVDTNPEATRRLGITRIPTACVVTADEQLLTKFELPETPAGFVAAAARAAQEAALASAAQSSSQGTTTESAASAREFAGMAGSGSGSLPSFGGGGANGMRTATTAEIRGTVPPGGKAINAVAAKVRMLSDFASDDGVPASRTESAIAASFRESDIPPTATPPASPTLMAAEATPTATAAAAPAAVTTALTAAPIQPSLAAARPVTTSSVQTYPAADTAAGGLGNTAPQAPLSIEPNPVAPSNTTARSAPWLGLPQQNQAAAPAQPEPPAAVTRSESLASGGKTAAGTQPQSESRQPAPTPAAAATPGSAATALAESKPQKPSATSSFLAAIQKPLSFFSKPAAAKAAPSVASTSPAATAQTAAAPATPTEPDTYGSMPVGLEGYCPVTLAERGVWVEGRAQWGARHRGRTYLFSGVEQQKAFLADPDRYAPALSGDDPVLAFDSGKSTPGQRRYGVTYQSRTYLFSSTETRDAFAANPQRYTSGALVAENRTPANGPLVR
jgi:YHS domain-containing protein